VSYLGLISPRRAARFFPFTPHLSSIYLAVSLLSLPGGGRKTRLRSSLFHCCLAPPVSSRAAASSHAVRAAAWPLYLPACSKHLKTMVRPASRQLYRAACARLADNMLPWCCLILLLRCQEGVTCRPASHASLRPHGTTLFAGGRRPRGRCGLWAGVDACAPPGLVRLADSAVASCSPTWFARRHYMPLERDSVAALLPRRSLNARCCRDARRRAAHFLMVCCGAALLYLPWAVINI